MNRELKNKLRCEIVAGMMRRLQKIWKKMMEGKKSQEKTILKYKTKRKGFRLSRRLLTTVWGNFMSTSKIEDRSMTKEIKK